MIVYPICENYCRLVTIVFVIAWCGVCLGLPTTVLAQTNPAFTGVTASAENATTAYSNPAGLTRIDHTQLVGLLTIGYSESDFKLKSSSTGTELGSITNDGLFFVPQLFLSVPFKEDWRFGFSLNVPSGIGSDYGEDWPGKYIVQDSSLVFVAATPTLAYRINDNWSLGGGLQFVYTRYEQNSAINNVPEDLPDGQLTLENDGIGLGFTVGVLYELSSQTRFGLSYRSETNPDLEGTPEYTNLGPVREQILKNAGVLGQPLNADLRSPQSVNVGIYHNLGNRWSVTADGAWIDFSEFGLEQVSVGPNTVSYATNYKDMWGGSLGAQYRFSEFWSGAVGAAYLSSGVDDENRTLAMPLDRIWGVGVGVARQLKKKRKIHINLNYYDLGKAPINNAPNELTGQIVGEYEAKFAILLDIGIVWGL